MKVKWLLLFNCFLAWLCCSTEGCWLFQQCYLHTVRRLSSALLGTFPLFKKLFLSQNKWAVVNTIQMLKGESVFTLLIQNAFKREKKIQLMLKWESVLGDLTFKAVCVGNSGTCHASPVQLCLCLHGESWRVYWPQGSLPRSEQG